MTKIELAKLLRVSRNTLTNWEKEKPELMKIINESIENKDAIEKNKEALSQQQEVLEKIEQMRKELKNEIDEWKKLNEVLNKEIDEKVKKKLKILLESLNINIKDI